jgi:hypothetical protein
VRIKGFLFIKEAVELVPTTPNPGLALVLVRGTGIRMENQNLTLAQITNVRTRHLCSTEAAVRLAATGYNSMALVTLTAYSQTKTYGLHQIQLKCFSKGSRVIKPGRNECLNISVAIKRRVWMDGWPMVEFVQI